MSSCSQESIQTSADNEKNGKEKSPADELIQRQNHWDFLLLLDYQRVPYSWVGIPQALSLVYVHFPNIPTDN